MEVCGQRALRRCGAGFNEPRPQGSGLRSPLPCGRGSLKTRIEPEGRSAATVRALAEGTVDVGHAPGFFQRDVIPLLAFELVNGHVVRLTHRGQIRPLLRRRGCRS